ncbi:hypothetical protein PspLS_05554 [Pyricularia sp. CBS 133598]|nr:hypothetical protein PspLS_05554 [Pyricularia sp. CBS 133598]
MYYECIQKLKSDISSRPSDRRLLQTASLLKKELLVVHDVVRTQARVIQGLASTFQSSNPWGTLARGGGHGGYYEKQAHRHSQYQTHQTHQTTRREYYSRDRQVIDESKGAWVERLTIQGNPDRPSHTTKWQYGLKMWFIEDIERISLRDSHQYAHLVGYVESLEKTERIT